MLHELSIENLGVIASARLTFGRGLTVVTGETGAGKTMVLTGLALVTGGKAPSAMVRGDADAALAEAVMDVPTGTPAAAALDDAGVVREDDGTVLISRSLGAQTRSRTVVGGRQIPQGLLADVAAELVTVHGQSDQVHLRSPARQRETLDRHAGPDHVANVATYRDVWADLGQSRTDLEAMRAGADVERQAVQHLRDDLAAVEAVAPQPGEDEALAAEAKLLENAEAVREGAAQAREALTGEAAGSVAAALEAAKRALGDAARHDESLAAHVQSLEGAGYAVADVGLELTRYLNELGADPEQLNRVQERRSAIAQLCRRLGRDVSAVLAFAEEAAIRVAQHDSWDERLAERERRVAELEANVAALAQQIHDGRTRAAAELAVAVNAELEQLAMATAEFGIAVEPAEPGPFGADDIAMTLSAHPGAPHRPVADAASGGELSRIMLALEVSLAATSTAPGHTFVFDEVDAGVGGKAAIAVGRRLAELARTQQVLVVTHLAQVAAYADHHVVVTKDTDGAVTTSQVTEVTGEARVQEVARLLSGQEDSSTARAHALELIEGSAVPR